MSTRPWIRATGERSGARLVAVGAEVRRRVEGCSSAARAAATTAGSNCVPAPASSSASADWRDIAGR